MHRNLLLPVGKDLHEEEVDDPEDKNKRGSVVSKHEIEKTKYQEKNETGESSDTDEGEETSDTDKGAELRRRKRKRKPVKKLNYERLGAMNCNTKDEEVNCESLNRDGDAEVVDEKESNEAAKYHLLKSNREEWSYSMENFLKRFMDQQEKVCWMLQSLLALLHEIAAARRAHHD